VYAVFMADPSNAAEYRRKAAACLEVAKRSSLREDHALMTDMAQRWLVLAQKAEANSNNSTASNRHSSNSKSSPRRTRAAHGLPQS
jgi:hypothetical protein